VRNQDVVEAMRDKQFFELIKTSETSEYLRSMIFLESIFFVVNDFISALKFATLSSLHCSNATLHPQQGSNRAASKTLVTGNVKPEENGLNVEPSPGMPKSRDRGFCGNCQK
jgi:hypothetical protein